MRIRAKKHEEPRKRTSNQAARKLTGTAVSAPDSALKGFSIDISETSGQAALAKLAKSRPVVRGFAAGGVRNLKPLDPETAAREHLDQALASDTIKKFVRPKIETAESEFKSLGSEVVPLTGTTVVKFCQMFNKIPVYGSLVTVELGKNNDCLGINSSLGTPTGVKHIATISPAQALETAAKVARLRAATLSETPRLYYYFDQNTGKWCLAYIIKNIMPRRPKRNEPGHDDATLKDYVIDAHTGEMRAELPRIATMATAVEVVQDANNKRRKITVETAAGGKRILRDSTLNVTTFGLDFKDPSAQPALLPGQLYEKPPAPWPLEAIGAHANGSEVAKFLRKVVLRNNIDNRGGEMLSTVNCWDRSEGIQPAKEWKNAYWNGDQMVYGQIKFTDGSFYSIASMLDVVGHEMFHGVTDYTSRLEYRTQAGALNESYSDIFGVIIANFSKPLSKWKWDILSNHPALRPTDSCGQLCKPRQSMQAHKGIVQA
jgi:Zn-dependent metalloprotease